MLQMFLIFTVLRRTLEINVSRLGFSDQSCLYIFIMSPCLSKSECVDVGKKVREIHLGLNTKVI